MSVIRLELTVADADAYEIANRLQREYAAPGPPPFACTGAMVQVLSDAEIQRERVILQAASYFMPERWQQRHVREC